jgi:ATP-binding cassette subfamily F protein uup
VGKSTFLQILSGQREVTSGIYRSGLTINLGYFAQNGLDIPEDMQELSVFEYVMQTVKKPQSLTNDRGEVISNDVRRRGDDTAIITDGEARKLLHSFQFDSEKMQTAVSNLSGGEKKRIQLLTVLARRPNVLLLDEPTNDLDLKSIQALEDYLVNSFEGCLLVISHDRYFLNAVTDSLFIFEGDGEITKLTGNYDNYLAHRRKKVKEMNTNNNINKTNNEEEK